MADYDRTQREQAGRCVTCGIATQKFYKINGRPFFMPRSEAGKVLDGVCIICSNAAAPKDPPESCNVKVAEGLKMSSRDAATKDKKITSSSRTEIKLDVSPPAQPVEIQEKTNHSCPASSSREDTVESRKQSSTSELKVKLSVACDQQQSYPKLAVKLDPPSPSTSSNNNHPPSPKSQSLDEAKTFIKQETEKKIVKRKPKPQIQSTRAVKRAREGQPKEGTQMELNRIMKKKGALSKDMVQSMLVAAVLARKKDKLCGDKDKFIGANGTYYPDLRFNFGKYSNMKQCGVCKQRVQGAYYCRLKHVHLEVADHDGGNSAECLKALFQKSVEELEDIQRRWMGDDQRQDINAAENDQTLALTHGREWSMDQLNEDLLALVASFIPTLPKLVLFCATSRRAHSLLTKATHSEKLYRGVFYRKFGGQGARGNYDINMPWRDRWTMLHNFKLAMQHQSGSNKKISSTSSSNLRRTVSVLSTQDEEDAIYYDNPQYADPDRDTCNGYFGIHILHLPPPPNVSTSDWQPPVLLHGDFNGVKIFNSLQETVQNPSGEDEQPDRFVSLGDDELGGQVLSLIHLDTDFSYAWTASEEHTISPPCCFIGFASGRVAALSAKLSDDKQQYNFIISSQSQAHDSEVTSFSFVQTNKDTTLLFSACCSGAVRFYPNALNPERFDLESSLAFANFYGCGIFSLCSTVVESTGKESFTVLITGDRDGKVRLWLVGSDVLSKKNFRHLGVYNSSTQSATSYHLVTRAKFINDKMLVTGTNQGDIRIWCMGVKTNPGRSIGKGPLPKLDLRYDLMGQHSGSVEVCVNVGNVLLTSGGDDGKIIGWDVSSGMKIGTLKCHQGKKLVHPDTGKRVVVRSAVVDVVLDRNGDRLISMCRDGTLAEWSFASDKTRTNW